MAKLSYTAFSDTVADIKTANFSMTTDVAQGYISLQLSRITADARPEIESVLGKLPEQVGMVSKHTCDDISMAVVCTGPRSWMILCPQASTSTLITRLHQQTRQGLVDAPQSYSFVDVSERAATFRLSGEMLIDILERTLELDPATIGTGKAARTLWNGVPVFVWHQDHDTALIAVDISLAWAFEDWVRSLTA